MLYRSNGLQTSGPRTLSGASLAQRLRRMSPPQRAVLAADILDGKVVLQGLTARSVAAIVGVNESYVFAALRISPEQRVAVARGERPLLVQTTRTLPAPIDWAAIDNKMLVEGAKTIGADRMLAAAVAAECMSQA